MVEGEHIPFIESEKKEGKIPVIIFGNGPVVDPVSGLRASDAHTPFGQERLLFWSDNLVKAANVLEKHGDADEYFVMGGPTGGAGYASEAALIRSAMQKDGINPDKIKVEEASMDTAENLVNFLNEYESPKSSPEDLKVDLLGVSSHIHRLKIYAKFFGIPVRHVYAAEEVMRFNARTDESGQLNENADTWKNDELTTIERMGDVNMPNPFFSDAKVSDKKGTETKEYGLRAQDDNLWVRELLEYPQRLLPIIAGLNNDKRVREMVHIQEVVHGSDALSSLGIDTQADTPTLREQLKKIKWPFLTPSEKDTIVSEWRQDVSDPNRTWPQAITDKYHRLMDYNPTLVPGLPVADSPLR